MSTPPAAGRTFADRLRSWPTERLAQLLRERPDLGTPVPADTGQLASRAATRTSLLRALDLLTHAELLVLDALVVLGQTSEAELVERVHADPDAASAATHRLLDLALVWDSPDGLRPLHAVAELVTSGGAGPGSGLLPVSAHPAEPAALEAALAGLSPQARALLEHVDSHGGRGTTGSAGRDREPGGPARTPVEELLDAGLLVRAGRDRAPGTVELPGEVGLLLRGGRTTTDPVDDVPAPTVRPGDPARCDRVAAGAAAESVRLLERLLEAWGAAPPGVLRSGGLAVRDLRTTARDLGVDEPTAALLLEVAGAAGLLTQGADRTGEPAWLPTAAYDAWSGRPTAERWATIAATWLATSRVPGLVGARDHAGRTHNALVPELSSSLAPETRHAVLDELAGAGAGEAVDDESGLLDRLAWRRPRRPPLRRDLARWTLREAAALGVTGMGALSAHGRALLGGGQEAAAAALAPQLPEPVTQVLLQADLTAVAPGPLTPEVARDLALLADLESSGGASVHRFTPASVRRALDAGWAADEVHAFVARVSATPVPQPLTYLVDDAARTHGRVRAGQASSFVRADDEAALSELLGLVARSTDLSLRRIAPTVLVSDAEVDELVATLRTLGASPVVEAADGTVHVVAPGRQRARAPRARHAAASVPAEPEQAAAYWLEAARAVRAGDDAAARRPPAVEHLSPVGSLAALREALEARESVYISYVDSHGTSTQRHVRPTRVEGGTLTAFDHRVAAPRTFAVHRITSVATARPS